MPEAQGGGIFISYRRQETSHLAGRLSDRLADRFGEGQVFIDVDTIEPGVDFAEEISRAVATCKVLLAVIGPNWLIATDERGRRRLDEPDDNVRLEIEAALARDVRVIPILVEGAIMPDRGDLPESLAGLARRNALFIRHESFRSDVGRLITAIERVLAAAPSTAEAASAQASGRAAPIGRADANVIHVSEVTFVQEVVERSRTVPVILELWAEWCDPCKQLSPVLEKLAGEANGAWVLARVDVDANPQLSAALQAQSIPKVVAITHGQLVNSFLGALPEASVREWIEQVVGSAR
jgi:thioredoxin